eukprot:scaffold205769_cov18-Tisochrysis_lutea.AAC.2
MTTSTWAVQTTSSSTSATTWQCATTTGCVSERTCAQLVCVRVCTACNQALLVLVCLRVLPAHAHNSLTM